VEQDSVRAWGTVGTIMACLLLAPMFLASIFYTTVGASGLMAEIRAVSRFRAHQETFMAVAEDALFWPERTLICERVPGHLSGRPEARPWEQTGGAGLEASVRFLLEDAGVESILVEEGCVMFADRRGFNLMAGVTYCKRQTGPRMSYQTKFRQLEGYWYYVYRH